MGIHCEYARLAAAELNQAQHDPRWALERLEALADEWVELDLPPDVARYFSLGGSWGPLHGLLLGRPGMAVDVVQGGSPLGFDGGLGPVRFLAPPDVLTGATFLAATPFTALADRFDLAETCDGEPCPDPAEHSPEEGLPLLEERYGELRRFYGAAAAAGDAVVLMLN